MRSRGAMKGITSVALGFFVLGLINGCAGPSRSEVSANAEPIEPPVSMAAEQSTALVLDNLPRDFQIDHFPTLYDKLLSSRHAVVTRGPFEAQAEYEQRLAASLGAVHLSRKVTIPIDVSSDNWGYTVEYDPDTEQMIVTIRPETRTIFPMSAQEPRDLLYYQSGSSAEDLGVYVDTDASGNASDLQPIKTEQYAIAVSYGQYCWNYSEFEKRLSWHVPREEARTLINTTIPGMEFDPRKVGVLLMGTLKPPYVLSDRGGIGAGFNEYDPADLAINSFFIAMTPDTIVIYNIETGKVYASEAYSLVPTVGFLPAFDAAAPSL